MAPRQRFERRLIAPSFNQHHGTCVGADGQRVCCRGDSWSTATARRPFDGCQVESLLVVHLPSLAAHTHLTTTTAAAHILCVVNRSLQQPRRTSVMVSETRGSCVAGR